MQIKSPWLFPAVLLLLLVVGYWMFPYLFIQVALWQRDFNQLLSAYLHQLEQQEHYAGLMLIAVSFLYGVLHAIGPGHGKFVIATYLSTHQSQFKSCIRLTFLSSLMQGIVAISATSLLVVLLNVSSSYFKLSQIWLERAAFILLFLLGLYWCYQSGKILYQQRKPQTLRIKNMTALTSSQYKIGSVIPNVSSHQSCDCGHQHLPNSQQLHQAENWKSQLVLILTIGMRPCSGAIFILFLAYMLDLYVWGIFATLAMAIGTGLMLTGFGLLVRYARQSAVNLGKWYALSKQRKLNFSALAKLSAGGILIFFALSLLYGTTLSQGGAILFN